MERPPTSRPKTSSGRPNSVRQRPSVIQNNEVPRPASRLTMSRMGAPSSPNNRPPTGFARPPSSAVRIPTSVGMRPQTGMARPPTGSNGRAMSQHGIRAPTRMGTAGNRQVFDKSYFMGLLRSKISMLTVEIAKLREKRQNAEHERGELHAYESRAQTIALEIRDLQGKLIDLNVIVDRMHMNGDVADLELEVSKLKENADELQSELDEVFRERQLVENSMKELQNEIEEQKKISENISMDMEENTKERFEKLKSECEKYRQKASEMEKELENLDEQVSKNQMDLENNPLKKKAVQLQETISNLKAKEEGLLKEKESIETPEQKKQRMVEEMKQLNNDIAVIEKQCEEVKEQIMLSSEELHEYDSQGDSKNFKHHAQYLELIAKDHQIEDLLQTYPKEIPLLQQDLEEYSSAILFNLKKISTNLKKINGDADDIDGDGIHRKIQTGSMIELKDLHIRLQEEILSIEDMQKNYTAEIAKFESVDKESSQAVDQLERETGMDDNDYKNEIENRKNQLEREVNAMRDEMNQLSRSIDSTRNELEANPNYLKLKDKFDQIEEIERKNATALEEIKQSRNMSNIDELKNEVLQLQQDYNKMLLNQSVKRIH